MAVTAAQVELEPVAGPAPLSYWRTVAWRLRRDPTTIVAAVLLLLIVLSALLAPVVSPYDPNAGSIRLRLASIGASGHPLGTDEQGRDMLSRLLHGGRMTLLAGLTPVVVAFLLGTALGVFAGYAGGLANTLIMRTSDIFYAFPAVLLAIAISGSLGPGLWNTLLSLSIVFVPRVVRVAESATVQVKSLEYIAAARASGAGVWPIMRHHLLANVLGPVLVFASTQVSLSIILAAGLSFLGLGVTPPAAEWGLMLNTLRGSIYVNALVPALPGVAIFLTSMTFNLLSDGLRDAMEIRELSATALLEVEGLRKHFPIRAGLLMRTRAWVRAVDEVSFSVEPEETLGIVGESGCGKSTLARLILRLIEPDAGSVAFLGEDLRSAGRARLKSLRRDMQLVFQDPHASLNPRMTIEDAVAFSLIVHGTGRPEARTRAWRLLDRVGLDPRLYGRRYPHELSGGQRQRVNIARALVLDPKLLVLDEPVSALDKSVQAQVLNLLQDLKAERALTYVFISHDLNVIEYVSGRVLVMYLGQVVETGTAEALTEPKHPYTQALFASSPSMDPLRRLERPPITGDPPNPVNPPSGCRFRTRCTFAMERCAAAPPPLLAIAPQHEVACYLYDGAPRA